MDDVLVTGLGALSPLGAGVDAFWRGMHKADTAPTRVPDPLAHMNHPLMYLVPEADLPDGPEEQDGLPLGRGSRFALAAAREAVADAGLAALPGPGERPEAEGLDPRRVAVALSTGMGDTDLHEGWWTGEAPASGRWAPPFPPASVVGGWFGAQGVNTCVSNACAASGYALSVGADLIRSGEADVVIAGGAEAYSRVALACFNRLGAIDPERCRPFAVERRGTVFGEGAAVLVLESATHARARGARTVYGRLAGAGWSCDAYHATAPEPSGEQIERAMREALREAGAGTGSGAGPGGLGFVIPHGTGTERGDVVESRVLDALTPRTPLYSVKALIGHTGGAAGAFAALAAGLVLHHRTLPPNVPVGERDPECAVPLPSGSAPMTGAYGLVNAYAFGGNNISLVFGEAAA
ncbi:beta-ketoacyl synthase N-terminal-like domain-containing protein [Streptomyces rapamycinicus]|uniref:3-oxoacyl-ACP synthase n=2 Tax=Streptomyces rapamycinicus TaxID=1226757 RepID=A0A0A0NK29_STRRN|nr:beta-ketoacyl synthase N-terminal-like domain-containing protein [Streptomyces rapamycinicus]AGP57561.1 3-oxoacyl-ACP synthase [Streptomyces rapamycinicus NRRL 5491]MBB4785221.1 3-oxoacyl-[acyl-carrier-protein] synthase II [Streptomyces rapamycinicus]RLV79307.1 3-oxoacyl-ACP synthase [Streptomyces rapamycinicus NRRL 5491]UTO65431.1 beta-ketoacyl-[acyl-carrier-protein] synthase family protein [Streptomyces rapamycinicus]UTP33387.1 beta-ketoacyl-[acyl-carrier-protein] synthase family protein 